MANNQNGAVTASRLAVAAANIAKGASSGGLYGAAVGAVKSFLPEILKVVAIVLCIAILLPLFIFLAIPNIFFGFVSSTVEDIMEFTNTAEIVRGIYEAVDFAAGLLEDLVDLILPDFWDDDGDPLYDDYEVEDQRGNLSLNWMVSIASVHFKQDLYDMNEWSLTRFLLKSLEYSAELADGLLTIKVWDLTPEGFMQKVGFSEEEQEWARLLHTSLEGDNQDASYEYSDGAGFYGTDYGDITFTDAATDVVYYNQSDVRWGGQSYGWSGTISSSACGPTALAMCVASLTGNQVTPAEVSKWSVDNGYRVETIGTSHALITDGGRHYGLNSVGVGVNESAVVDALKSGKLVIAIMGPGHFTSSGHFIVLRGVTADGQILVADPISVTRSNQTWPLRLITNELNRMAGAGGPYWVLSR